MLTPHGSLRLDQAEDEFSLEDGLAERLEKCFARGSGSRPSATWHWGGGNQPAIVSRMVA
jgi:hypothetical protein